MGWLKWREALKPSGLYNRRQFLFWLFIPIICILLLVTNIWELEKLLIKFSYHAGFLGFDVEQICNFLSILLVAFLIYMTVITMMRRCHDLNISSWLILTVLVPVLGLLFFVYLMFWPGKPPPGEVRTTHWIKTALLSLAAAVVSLTIIYSSFWLSLYANYAIRDTISEMRNPWDIAPFRIWNQTDQLLDVQIIARDNIVHQGYPTVTISSKGIIKYEELFIGRDEYTVKAENSEGEVIYSRDFTAEEMAKLDWIIVIP